MPVSAMPAAAARPAREAARVQEVLAQVTARVSPAFPQETTRVNLPSAFSPGRGQPARQLLVLRVHFTCLSWQDFLLGTFSSGSLLSFHSLPPLPLSFSSTPTPAHIY